MRAKDFIVETQRGKPLDAHAKVSPGAAFTLDGFGDLYRASQMMARCPDNSDDIDAYSYVTNRPMIVTYTDEEKEMVKAAFKKMGIDYHEHFPGGSEEPGAINNVSPAVSFKGY
jgi:hypothetical protein